MWDEMGSFKTQSIIDYRLVVLPQESERYEAHYGDL